MKNIVAASAIVFLFIINIFIYIRWTDNTAYSSIINLNGYIIMDVSNNLEEGQHLRPQNSFLSINEVDEVIYTYTVYVKNNLEIDALINNVILNYADSNKMDEAELISTEILSMNIIDHHSYYYVVTIDISLTIRPPVNDQERTTLLNAQSFSFNLMITPKN
ncbi:hypothetical protein [Liberiplasma polymorphum]|uniref:hypothetical protein n=1 Tax=Liberiplasma polymorphum TaxID=3374570 RepID=UPI003772ADB0